MEYKHGIIDIYFRKVRSQLILFCEPSSWSLLTTKNTIKVLVHL